MLLSIREWYMDRKKLINQSIDYIMKHLDENLSLDTVAAHFFYIEIPLQPNLQGRNRRKCLCIYQAL